VLPILARDAVVAGMSAKAILAAGAGAAVGILIGGGISGAVVLALVAWLVAVAIPVVRRHRVRQGPGVVDPFSLREPWRRAVQQAIQAQNRFAVATAGVSPGPLKDRLQLIAARLDQGVLEAGRVAQRGQRLEDVRRQIDTKGVLAELAAVERSASPSRDRTVQALRAQLASAERLDGVLEETRDRLTLLDARLDEAVARSLELSVGSDPAELGGVGTTVDEVLEEMEALRLALDEADGGPALPP
jgi:hypothetical protein